MKVSYSARIQIISLLVANLIAANDDFQTKPLCSNVGETTATVYYSEQTITEFSTVQTETVSNQISNLSDELSVVYVTDIFDSNINPPVFTENSIDSIASSTVFTRKSTDYIFSSTVFTEESSFANDAQPEKFFKKDLAQETNIILTQPTILDSGNTPVLAEKPSITIREDTLQINTVNVDISDINTSINTNSDISDSDPVGSISKEESTHDEGGSILDIVQEETKNQYKTLTFCALDLAVIYSQVDKCKTTYNESVHTAYKKAVEYKLPQLPLTVSFSSIFDDFEEILEYDNSEFLHLVACLHNASADLKSSHNANTNRGKFVLKTINDQISRLKTFVDIKTGIKNRILNDPLESSFNFEASQRVILDSIKNNFYWYLN
ncbi:hypothetical protein BB561_005465 [Smittium simulii]|uniref:Uncharacterized protein n=1 Tax=Smittium simulii TaxID=133385 RepID=A0A2T9YA87_9FUNG|nr:hypothetical protein BB561_005465 [Smittium simulii]